MLGNPAGVEDGAVLVDGAPLPNEATAHLIEVTVDETGKVVRKRLVELIQSEFARDMAMCGKVNLKGVDRTVVKVHRR